MIIVIYRDKSEEKKTLTEEDKKLIRIRVSFVIIFHFIIIYHISVTKCVTRYSLKDMGQTATVRRKERALKIQMSSFSES